MKIEKYAAMFEVEMILNIFQRTSDNRVIIYIKIFSNAFSYSYTSNCVLSS